MRVGIAGLGVVTPLGNDVQTVAGRVKRGEAGRRILDLDTSAYAPPGRMRRAPAVSSFAIVAAGAALVSAGKSGRDAEDPRFAVVAAISHGAHLYSAKFHEQFVRGGASSVQPLLFPETVLNAPASHIASVFGLTGPNLTLIGDSAVAFNALATARDLLNWHVADSVLVVASHEHSPLFEDAYRRLRWVFPKIPFSEGAGAVVLDRERASFGEILHVDRGFHFRSRRNIPALLEKVVRDVPGEPTILSVSSEEWLPLERVPRVCFQSHLGEAFSAGALWQVLVPLSELGPGESVLAVCVGLSGQVSAVLARR